MNNPICPRKAIYFLASLLSMLAASPSFSQVVIKDKVEIDGALATTQAIQGIGFVATQTGVLEVELGFARRNNIAAFPANQVFLGIYQNGNLILDDTIFNRNWSVNTGTAPCGGPDVSYSSDEIFIVGNVNQGDEILLRLLTDNALLGDTLGTTNGVFYDLSVINYVSEAQSGIPEHWNVLFEGQNGVGICPPGFFREEVALTIRYTPEPFFFVAAEPNPVLKTDTSLVSVTINNPGYTGGLYTGEFGVDLTLSDPTKGHLQLIHEASPGVYTVEQSGSVLDAVPYSALDPTYGASDRFVNLVADAEPAPAKINDFSAKSVSGDTLQITANHSDHPGLVGEGQVVVDSIRIEILNASNAPADYLQIANWEYAYDANELVKNDAANNFIDLDPQSFYIRVTDVSMKDVGSPGGDIVTIDVQTSGLKYGGDNPTEITLYEDPNDQRVFISKALILTPPDFDIPEPIVAPDGPLRETDDDFEVHDGVSGTVKDDSLNDRTHNAEVGGFLDLEYYPFPNNTESVATLQLPVCEDIKTVKYRLVTFREPYWDVGFVNAFGDTLGANNGQFDCEAMWPNDCKDLHLTGGVSEPYLNVSWHYENEKFWGYTISHKQTLIGLRGEEQPGTERNGDTRIAYSTDNRGPMVSQEIMNFFMDQTQISWSPACIQFETNGPALLLDAPKDESGIDIFLDGRNNSNPDKSEDDLLVLYDSLSTTMSQDTLYVFFGPQFRPLPSDTWGIAKTIWSNVSGANYSKYTSDMHSYAYMSSQARPYTVAHEFGHILTRLTGHAVQHLGVAKEEDGPQFLIFPSWPVDDSPTGQLVNYQVNKRRRFLINHLNMARTHPNLIVNQ